MATIHDTTMSPGKLELLTGWLPGQPWYPGREPVLARAGGFRLDDPDGAVGIEFMLVNDTSGDRPVTLHVPMTYRASALAGADSGLIGRSEHGVLGSRWIYDGTRDPVLIGQLVALIQGETEPQAQSLSDTPDPTVSGVPVTGGSLIVTGSGIADSSRSGTDLRIGTASADGTPGQLTIRIIRVVHPGGAGAPPGGDWQPCLSATWRQPDGTRVRGNLAAARYDAAGE